MNCSTVKGAAQATGAPVSMTFDPHAEPARAWMVAIGDRARGVGPTPEEALNAAVASLENAPEPRQAAAPR